MEVLCCVETAQPLLMDPALQGDHLAPHFTVWQQEQDPDKGWVPPTAAEISAWRSCTKGTEKVLGEPSHHNKPEGKGPRALHTPHVWNGHCLW